MLELFDFGKFFIDTFDRIGDFLLSEPAPVVASMSSGLVSFMESIGLHSGADLVAEFFSSDLTIATLILGPSLVAILTIRFVKFFIDFL